jgi:Formate--tetrahydrofolate ligase
MPTLMMTAEQTPALVHTGPFANIGMTCALLGPTVLRAFVELISVNTLLSCDCYTILNSTWKLLCCS